VLEFGKCVCASTGGSMPPARIFNQCLATIQCPSNSAPVAGSNGFCGCAAAGGGISSPIIVP
jgi:hypothetical protein